MNVIMSGKALVDKGPKEGQLVVVFGITGTLSKVPRYGEWCVVRAGIARYFLKDLTQVVVIGAKRKLGPYVV